MQLAATAPQLSPPSPTPNLDNLLSHLSNPLPFHRVYPKLPYRVVHAVLANVVNLVLTAATALVVTSLALGGDGDGLRVFGYGDGIGW